MIISSIGEALLQAIVIDEKKTKEDKVQERDYWSDSIGFINECFENKEELYLISNYYWYSHVIYGLPSKRVKSIRYYKAGGYSFMTRAEFEELIDEKNNSGILMQIMILKETIIGMPNTREVAAVIIGG